MRESIVVGTDGSETAKAAVDEAIRIAEALGAEKPLLGLPAAKGCTYSVEPLGRRRAGSSCPIRLSTRRLTKLARR